MQTAPLAEYYTSVKAVPEVAALGAELDEIGTDMSEVASTAHTTTRTPGHT